MSAKNPTPPPPSDYKSGTRPTSPPPMACPCQYCEKLRDELRESRAEAAMLLGELQAYRFLDAAGRIQRY